MFKKKFFLISLLFAGLICYGQSDCDLIIEFRHTNFEIIKDTVKIPTEIKEYFYKQFQRKFSMANPGNFYNNTDMITPGMPDERLVVFGFKEEANFFFLYFETGGALGIGNVLFLIKKDQIEVKTKVYKMFASQFTKKIKKLKKIVNCESAIH